MEAYRVSLQPRFWFLLKLLWIWSRFGKIELKTMRELKREKKGKNNGCLRIFIESYGPFFLIMFLLWGEFQFGVWSGCLNMKILSIWKKKLFLKCKNNIRNFLYLATNTNLIFYNNLEWKSSFFFLCQIF